MARKHDEVARKLARKEGVPYNEGPGADIKGRRRAIEVETPGTIGDGARQLRGYNKPVYVAVTDPKAVKPALERYKDTTIGVMTPTGRIVKRSKRKRRPKGTHSTGPRRGQK